MKLESGIILNTLTKLFLIKKMCHDFNVYSSCTCGVVHVFAGKEKSWGGPDRTLNIRQNLVSHLNYSTKNAYLQFVPLLAGLPKIEYIRQMSNKTTYNFKL